MGLGTDLDDTAAGAVGIPDTLASVQRGAGQREALDPQAGRPDGHHLGVGGGVEVGRDPVGALPDHHLVAHDVAPVAQQERHGNLGRLSLKEIAAASGNTGGPIAGHSELVADGAGVSFATLTVSVEEPEAGTLAGANAAVAPAGRSEAASETVPSKPFWPAIESVYVALAP